MSEKSWEDAAPALRKSFAGMQTNLKDLAGNLASVADRTTALEAAGGSQAAFPGPVLPPWPDEPKARTSYLKALCAFQAESIALPKDAKGHSYVYTDLASSLSTLRPVLAKHGLVLTFRPWTVEPGVLAVVAVLEHVDGFYSTTQAVAKVADVLKGGARMNPVQAQGAVQTYLQRYTMMGLLGLTGAIDTDGVAEQQERRERTRDDTPPDDGPDF